MDVVDCHQQWPKLGERTRRGVECDGHGTVVGRRPVEVTKQKRDLEHPALRTWQLGQQLVEHRGEQVTDCEEREAGLLTTIPVLSKTGSETQRPRPRAATPTQSRKPAMHEIRVSILSPEAADHGVAELWVADELIGYTILEDGDLILRVEPRRDRTQVVTGARSLAQVIAVFSGESTSRNCSAMNSAVCSLMAWAWASVPRTITTLLPVTTLGQVSRAWSRPDATPPAGEKQAVPLRRSTTCV